MGSNGEFEFSIDGQLAYSRKREGRFPEMRELTQAVAESIDKLRPS